MLIENESQWNTDDLRAITKLVVEKNGLRIADDFMLLFKTCRQKVRRRHGKNGEEERVVPPAAQIGYMRGGFGSRGDYAVVDIYSKDKLIEKNALERLGQVALADVVQDLYPHQIRQIAAAILQALSGRHRYYGDPEKDDGCGWAEKCQLRAAPKIKRSEEVVKRKIVALEEEKARLKRRHDAEMRTMNEKIEKLKNNLTKIDTKISDLQAKVLA